MARTQIVATVFLFISTLGAAAGVDLVCIDLENSERYSHVRIDGNAATIRTVGLGAGKNEELDYTYQKAYDSTEELLLKESRRYFYWYDLGEAQEYFDEPENITLDGLNQKVISAINVWESITKQMDTSGFYFNFSRMLIIDRSTPALYQYTLFRDNLTGASYFNDISNCEIFDGIKAKELMDSKLSDFMEIELESINSEKEDAETKF